MPAPSLPPSLAALADAPPMPLQSVGLRLSQSDLARIEALRDRLNGPTRGALLRWLVCEGLRAAEAQLAAAAEPLAVLITDARTAGEVQS